MMEKLNKIITQNALAMVIVLGCFALAFVATKVQIPADSLSLINKVIDMSLVGVIGWLFTQSKKSN